jgi:hypothetical protein
MHVHHVVGAAQLKQRLALWAVGMALAQEPPQTRLPFPQGISTLSPTRMGGEQGDIPLSSQLRQYLTTQICRHSRLMEYGSPTHPCPTAA